MSVALSIAFTGLCALIAGGDGKPGQVLLVDAKGVGPVGGVALPEHAPTLVLSLNDLANPESSRPTRVVAGRPDQTGRIDQLGIWDLTGVEVRIRAQGAAGPSLKLFEPSSRATSWPHAPRNPNDPAAWRDLRFVPNMTTLVGDGRIDPELIGSDAPGTARLPPSVAARIHLDAGLLEGAIPSQETYRNDVFEFTTGGAERSLRQALTDTVQWTLKTDASAVVIDLIPAGGGETRRLLLAPSATPHRVFVSNLPSENSAHVHATTDDAMAGQHFGAYYALLMEQPTRRPLPTVSMSADSRSGTGGVRPVFCHLAMFSRP